MCVRVFLLDLLMLHFLDIPQNLAKIALASRIVFWCVEEGPTLAPRNLIAGLNQAASYTDTEPSSNASNTTRALYCICQ